MVIGDLATAVDVLVLGAGPGGYVAAIRAAQLGKQVAIIDAGPLGGICLNHGCIPSKALLSAADRYAGLSDLKKLGIRIAGAELDYSGMQKWKDSLVKRLNRGIEQLLKSNSIQIIYGRGWFIGPNDVRVEGEHGSQRFSFTHCIIATGAEPAPLPDITFDGKQILTLSEALHLKELPKEINIIGSDYIALELATLYNKLGTETRLVIPTGETLLVDFEPLAVREITTQLKKSGVKLDTELPNTKSNLTVVSSPLHGRSADLDLAEIGLQCDSQGFIPVNAQQQTNRANIYAIGDITGGTALAHCAIKQGKVAAEHIAGQAVEYAPQALPQVIWSEPQLASVGLTEAAAKVAGYDTISERFPMAANGRALTLNMNAGFAQIIAERDSGIILGVTLLGQGAEIAIAEAALAIEMGATLVDLAETLHPHPGLSEPLQEAVETALGLPVHMLPKTPSR